MCVCVCACACARVCVCTYMYVCIYVYVVWYMSHLYASGFIIIKVPYVKSICSVYLTTRREEWWFDLRGRGNYKQHTPSPYTTCTSHIIHSHIHVHTYRHINKSTHLLVENIFPVNCLEKGQLFELLRPGKERGVVKRCGL